MYNKVSSAVDSVGVSWKEKFGIFIFFTVLVFLSILVSSMSKLILVDLIKYSQSSKFLFEEQVSMWSRARQLFLLENFRDSMSSKF